MAIRFVGSEIQASPNPFSPSGPIAFSVSLRDDTAPPGTLVSHVLRLTLRGDNKLTFEGGAKFLDKTRSIGASATLVAFNERIVGVTTGFGFNVALFKDSEMLTFVDVTIG
jgi:hypothetical protein